MRSLLLLIIALGLAGCRHRGESPAPRPTPPIRKPVDLSKCFYLKIESFHRLTDTNPTSFAVMGATNKIGGIENDFYLGLVRTQFLNLQHTDADPRAAQWLVMLHYETLPTQKITEQVPIYDTVRQRHSGVITTPNGPRFYGGSTTSREVKSIETRTTPVLTWFVRVEIYDGTAFRLNEVRQLYDARCTIVGEKGNLAQAMPLVIREIFKRFPGDTSTSRETQVFYD